MSRKKGKGKSFINEKSLSNSILGIFTNDPKKTFNYKQLSKQLFIKSSEERQFVSKLLNTLKNDGFLEEIQPGRYKLKSAGGYIIGKLEISSGGYGFVATDSFDEDVFVSQKNLHHALNGDIVKVYLFARKKKLNPEGEVVQIIERTRDTFVGILEILDRYAFCIAESRQMPYDIFVPLDKLGKGKNSQKEKTGHGPKSTRGSGAGRKNKSSAESDIRG